MRLRGYKVVYVHNGYELSAGNPITFPDRETAERYMKGWQKKPWFRENMFIIEISYEGEPPTPCREYNGKRVYNSDYWFYDGAEIGDLVEEEIVDNLINSLPPACMRSDCIQGGEPSNHKIDEMTGEARATYPTFKRVSDGIWEWCGNCFRGENVERGNDISIVNLT